MNYSDKVPFDDLHTQIFNAVVEAMTARHRGDALDKYDGNLECLKQNWEGFHLFEYVWAIRLKQDENGENLLDIHLDKNGIRGIDGLRKLAHDQKSAFSDKTHKAEKVFESLAEFQDIPTLVCFSDFLEFCQKSYPRRPLDVFDGENKISIPIDGKRTIVTIDYAIKDIKRHVYFWEKSHKPPQPDLTVPEAEKNNRNYFANRVIEKVIGRIDQEKRLKAFLECDKNVAWFQLAGEAGQGKSRLAFDLMREASKNSRWNAGFVEEDAIEFFKDHGKDWQPDKPHLLIFDYVIGREQEIKPILQTLISNPNPNQNKYHHDIRILLVERQSWDQESSIKEQDQKDNDKPRLSANIADKAQWFLNLCKKNDFKGKSLESSRFEDGVEELKELGPDELVTIVKQVFSGKELTVSDDELKQTLKRIDGSGRPLCAYLLAQQLSDSQEGYQSWTKIDLLNAQLMRDRNRWQHAFKDEAPPVWGDHHPAMKLAVLATMVRKVRFQDDEIKQYFGNIDSPLGKKAVAITSGHLANESKRPHVIDALEPDLLGEWFVLHCFLKGLEFEELLDIAWQYWPNKMAAFLLRITQNFIDLPKENKNWDITEKLIAFKPSHKNHHKALINVATAIADKLYQRGLTIPENIISAVRLGDYISDIFHEAYLDFIYGRGIDVATESITAVDLYRYAVKLGDSQTILNLGYHYQNGEGVAQNWDEAIKLYRQAVELGNSDAMVKLALCYQNGEGVAQNWDKAIDLYQQAVNLGNSQAMSNLGLCYREGIGVVQDLVKTIDLYQQAVKLGNSQAMFNLAICYQEGKGVAQNWDEAISLYRQAVKLGNSQAMFNLAICYQIGKGVAQNWDEAIDLYQQAVELDNCQAMVNLGYHYQNGEGVAQSWDEAIKLLQRAVKLGDSLAMFNLGYCYQCGEGDVQDWNKAIDLYHLAAKAGVKEAIDNIQDILLQNFLGNGNYKTRKTRDWQNNKLHHLTTVPVFDPPIMGGDWKQLIAKEVTVCLDKVIAPFEVLELAGKLDGYICQYARHLPLSFYKDCSLVDIQLYNPSNKNTLIFSAVSNSESAILLNGKENIFHDLNPHLLAFDDNKSILDYLQFFHTYVQGNVGCHQIISNLNEIPFNDEASQHIRNKIKENFFSPRHIEGSFEKEGWQQFEACVLYGDTFFSAAFKVFPDGKISPDNDNLILDKLPIFQRQYDGVFRTPLRSLHD